CLQLDLHDGGAPKVYAYTFEDQEKDKVESNIFVLNAAKRRPLDSTVSLTNESSSTPSESDSVLYKRMIRELAASETRIRSAKDAVKLLQEEVEMKRQQYAEMEARRNRAAKQ
ncbi:MAG: hypothetical protein SGARI_007718, partial [Bacillariaceae sp.]